MVRLFIRNGTCGIEEFFKLLGTKSKVTVFLACCQKETATFQELNEYLLGSVEPPMLAKRLTEFTESAILDKLVYGNMARTTYRITQKAVDILPALNLMQTFCNKWLQVESKNAFDWITYTRKLLGSRWNARIIWLLFVLRHMRFNELKNSIEGISFKMLTQQLRYLETEATVLRTDFQESPPHTEYSLTDKGMALYEILLAVSLWDAHYVRGKDGSQKGRCGVNLSI